MRHKIRIPDRVRREVALREGCEPGETHPAACAYCSKEGEIIWQRLSSGRPGGWVHFRNLHLDHVHPEHLGGAGTTDNVALACQRCNSSKGHKLLEEWAA